MNSACPACSLVFVADGNEGFSFRASSLNFGATVVLFYGPLLCVALAGWLTEGAAEFVAIAGTVVVPAALYRPSCSWSLTNHYLFFPEDLPANGGGGGESSRPAKADGPA